MTASLIPYEKLNLSTSNIFVFIESTVIEIYMKWNLFSHPFHGPEFREGDGRLHCRLFGKYSRSSRLS